MAAKPTPSFGATPRDIEVDACTSCNLFWFDRAESIWRSLLARAPANAPWRPELEQRLIEIERMKQQQMGR